MRLLITNDDGVESTSLHKLCLALSQDHEVHCVAPRREQSGVGQAISIYTSLTYTDLTNYPYPTHSVLGTPSDCVKLAICHIYHGVPFDLVISGINPGENAGLSAIYSGTVAAAREAATWGVPGIAVSVWDKEDSRFDYAAEWMARLLSPSFKMDARKIWNINFPPCTADQIKGVKVCRMSMAMYKDNFVGLKTPRGTTEYWLDGEKPVEHFTPESDDYELRNRYITVTPLSLDQTDSSEIKKIQILQNQLPHFSTTYT